MAEDVAAAISLSRNAAAGRYEIAVDGQLAGLADFHRVGNVVVLPHTETFPQYGGRGLASQLIRFALDDIASAGLQVQPDCSFVERFLQRHPDYLPLKAP